MKNTFLILSLLFLSMGCNKRKPTYQKTVTKYYNAFDSGDYNKIRALINDTITITSGDYSTPYTHEDFYEFFKWDSIFKTSYKLVGLEEKSNSIVASVALSSVRNEFLKNNNMTCDYRISFDSGKISKIEESDCTNVDWSVWQKERDSLAGWIKKNHPELDGFLYDMTMNGATNYLRAIELYETDKNAL